MMDEDWATKMYSSDRPAEKQKRYIFGGYNWQEDSLVWTTAKTKNRATFINFLEELLVKRYPTGRAVLDIVAYHKSASALAVLSLFEHRVLIVWLPVYCSDLNPI